VLLHQLLLQQHLPGGTEGASCQKLCKKKKFHVPSISAYEGKCEEIKHHVYNVVQGKNGFDLFAKTTTKIREYIAQTVPNTSKFTLVMQPNKLCFPVIPTPPSLTSRNDLIELKVWCIANKQYNNLLESKRKTSREHMPLFGASVPQLFKTA
jgi:hypothetical protein